MDLTMCCMFCWENSVLRFQKMKYKLWVTQVRPLPSYWHQCVMRCMSSSMGNLQVWHSHLYAFSCSGFSQDNNSNKSICLWINQTKVLEFLSPPNILSGGGSLGVGCGSGSAMGWNVQVDQKISLQAGSNSIALLSMTVGLQVCSCLLLITDTLPVWDYWIGQLFVNEAFTQILSLSWQNYGAYLETWGAGIQGSVLIRGLPSGDLDLTSHTWVYQVSCLRGSFLSCPFWICRSTTVITFGAESDHRLQTVVFCDSTKMEHWGNLEESSSVHGSNTCGLWFWMSVFRWD